MEAKATASIGSPHTGIYLYFYLLGHPKDLCFLVKWVPFEMLVFGYIDSVVGAPDF